MPGGLPACAEGWRETHSTQDLGSPGKAASFSQTAFPKRASGYSPTRIKGAKGRRGAGRLAMQGTGRGQLGRALRPGSPARAHSWVREGGAAPARTFQRLLRPSSLFSPVPVISQAVLDPALSANSQNPSRFWSQLQGPWSECPDHLPWNNCLPTTHTHTHTQPLGFQGPEALSSLQTAAPQDKLLPSCHMALDRGGRVAATQSLESQWEQGHAQNSSPRV